MPSPTLSFVSLLIGETPLSETSIFVEYTQYIKWYAQHNDIAFKIIANPAIFLSCMQLSVCF